MCLVFDVCWLFVVGCSLLFMCFVRVVVRCLLPVA